MTTTTTKTRTITMTGRRPVKIKDDEWPVLARGSGDSYGGGDYACHQQALAQGECDTYILRVRQHADGRTLVYGIVDAAAAAWGSPAGGESYRGGMLLDPPAGAVVDPIAGVVWDGIVRAIEEVGRECGIPYSVVRECIAGLPAQEI